MRKLDWKEIAELVGIAAIVASLLFVGLQLRQTQEIAVSEAYQARAFASTEYAVSVGSSPYIQDILEKGRVEGYESLSAEEKTAVRTVASGVMYLYDNTHFQYENGFVTDERWAATRAILKNQMTHPVWRASILRRMDRYRPSFRAIIDEISNEIAKETSR